MMHVDPTPSSALQIDDLLYMDSACNEYEVGFRCGQAPRLEDVVDRAPAHLQKQLVIELIEFEALVRRERNEVVTLQEYLKRFPEWSNDLSEALRGTFHASSDNKKLPWQVPGYEIESEIGRGGMGIVYKAKQLNLDRTVAVKKAILSSESNDSEVRRFRTEAESVARLQHPNIIQVFEVGQSNNIPYIAMEYVEGGSLSAYLLSSPMEFRDAASLVHILAMAISYAHEMGIIHRDLKPANILLTSSAKVPDSTAKLSQRNKSTTRGSNLSRSVVRTSTNTTALFPKIADFGLAKQIHADHLHTQTGTVLGTPSYMAPEQTMGQANEVGPLTDVYSLGAILYECMVGAPPFRAASTLETIEQVRTKDPIPPSRIQSNVPRDLETICLKCLEKSKDRRYASALELAEDLGHFLEGLPIKARPINPIQRCWRWANRHPLVASLMGVVATLILAITVIPSILVVELQRALSNASQNEHDAVLARAEAEKKAIESQSRLVGMHIATGASKAHSREPLSATLWYSQAWLDDIYGSRNDHEHRMRIGFSLSQIPELTGLCIHSRPITDSQISVDSGRLIIGDRSPKAHVWNPFRGEQTGELDHGKSIASVDLSADGSLGMTCSDDDLALWNMDSMELRHRMDFDSNSGTVPISCAAISADKKFVIASSMHGDLALWDALSGERLYRENISSVPTRIIQFSPDGSMVVLVDEMDKVMVLRTHDRVLLHIGAHHRGKFKQSENVSGCVPQFTANGKHLLLYHNRTIQVWDTQTWRELSRRNTLVEMNDLSLSGDGSRLVVTTGGSQARLMAFDGNFPTSIEAAVSNDLPNPRNTHLCSISRDGKLVATSSSGGVIEIWDGENGERRTSLKCYAIPSQLQFYQSSDSHYLLYVCSSDGVIRVWKMNEKGVNASQLIERPYSFACGRAHLAGWLSSENGPYCLSPDAQWELRIQGNQCELYNRKKNERSDVILGHDQPIKYAMFADNGRRALASDGKDCQIYDLESKQTNRISLSQSDEVIKLRMSANGTRLMVARSNKWVQVIEVDTGRVLLDSKADSKETGINDFQLLVQATEFSEPTLTPDGQYLVIAAHRDSRSVVFRISDGAKVFETDFQRGVPAPYSFSDDSSRIALGNSDTRARVWSMESKLPLGPLLRHPTYVRRVSLSHDGNTLVTTSADQRIRFWNSNTGDLIGDCVNSAPRGQSWLNLNGRALVQRRENGNIYELELPFLSLNRKQIRSFVDLVCCERIEQAHGTVDFEEDHFYQDAAHYLEVWRHQRVTRLQNTETADEFK